MQALRIGTSGMRGKIASALTPRLAINFASAFGTYVEGGKVVVASDTRVSSPMFTHAAISALLSCGCDVLDAGIISAPELHFMVPHLKADGGLLIGAGHHPTGWNALAPVSKNGAYFTGVFLQELLDIYHSHKYINSSWDQIGHVSPVPSNETEIYLDALCSKLDVDVIAAANFTVIADFCNGSGSPVAEKFASRLGIKMISINSSLSGLLPHDPEPRPRSAQQVHSVLKPMKADIGFVFNSDMSRASIVTSSGETLSEEYTIALVADQILSRADHPLKVVTNTCTTRTLDDVVKRHEGSLIKTRVGEAYIIDKMLEIKADLAGDGSGSAAFGGHLPGFDNFMVMGVILEAMAKQQCTSAELVSALSRYHIVKRSISCPSVHAYTLIRRLKDQFPEATVSDDDGYRFDWPDGWVHLRAAMTEPIIRMVVEWRSKEKAEDMALQVRGLLERLIRI